MTSPGEGGLAYWREHREQLRQSENQRAVLTNFVLVIAAALSGFIVQLHFELRTLPLSVLIVVIGCYGALAAAKYHERAVDRASPGHRAIRRDPDHRNGPGEVRGVSAATPIWERAGDPSSKAGGRPA